MSVTSTKWVHKLDFPTADWPIVDFPAVKHPLDSNIAYNREQEKKSLTQVYKRTWEYTMPKLLISNSAAFYVDN